jgi:hypothetical protein
MAEKEERFILLIEDNPDDLELNIRASKKNNILKKVIVAKDGVGAIRHIGLYWLLWGTSLRRRAIEETR